ncbi:hypothetical protein PR048_005351 [Dryococelus australis]|uniref:Uncharacterized protein n=1 Tax=Dryococelus australis TaxID=614101 RepID=A0ABQ9I7W1_9NEOP|nr:hypothetical protein PR048_005351 [Dryococelus australis]
MIRFVKPDILQGTSLVTKVDLSGNSLLPAKLIDVGFATQYALRRAKMVPEADLLKFKADCLNCFQKLCTKLLERSSLKFLLSKGISCFDPSVGLQTTIRNKCLESTLNVLVQNNLMSSAPVQSSVHFKNLMSDFTNGGRLDTLWMAAVPDDLNYLDRGFSINKECLVGNQRDASLIAVRQVYDAVLAGGVEKVIMHDPDIRRLRNNKKLISRWNSMLSERRKEDKRLSRNWKTRKKSCENKPVMKLAC